MTRDEELTAYCGLYCSDCIPSNKKLFSGAEKLREELDEIQFDKYAEHKSRVTPIFEEYAVFRKVLSALIGLKCAGPCISNGGILDCRIRICAREKGLRGCWECTSFEDCGFLDRLQSHGDTLRVNLRLIKEYGLENWADKRGKHYVWNK